jgi:tetratricopeptide (TPR) repeat protein
MEEFKNERNFEGINIPSPDEKSDDSSLSFSSKDEGSEAEADKPEGESKTSLFFDWAIKIGLYLLAFLTPLFFLPYTANVLELNKQFLLFIFSFVLLVFWLGKVLTQRKIEIKKSLLNILIILFVLSVVVSSLFAQNRFQSLIGSGNIIAESFLTLFCLAIIYFLVSSTLKTKKDLNPIILALLVSSVLAGIFALLQLNSNFIFGWGWARTVSFNTIGSVNGLEIFLAAVLVLAVALFADPKRSLWQSIVLAVASAFLLFLIIALNFANVWWGLIGIMILVVGFGIMKQGRASQTRLILAMVVLAMALMLTLTKINISSGWLNIPAEISPTFGSTVQIDKGALSNKLFFGTGPGRFAYNWELFRSPLINQTAFWNIRFSQGISKVFSMPASLGIIGAGFWILLAIFFAVWGAMRLISKKGENWNLAFGFFSSWLFLAGMQFLYPTNLTLEFMFWLSLGISLSLLKGLESEEGVGEAEGVLSLSFRKESPLASVFSFLLVIFLVLTISFFYLGFNYWRADAAFQRGTEASVIQGNLEIGYNEITKAISLNPYSDIYLNSLSQVALLRINEELAKPASADRDLRAQQFVADAVNLSKAAADLNSQNPDNWIQRGIVYRSVLGYLSGADQWMLNSFSEASKLQPKNPYVFFELGRSYSLLVDYTLAQGQTAENQAKALDYLNKAEEQFNKAIEVKSDYAPAHYQLALIYDRQGKNDSAINKMEITKASFPNDIGLAFQLGLLYYKKQDFAKSQAEFERAVSLDQNYSNARYFLGLIYDNQGNKAAAKDQFLKIIELNPDNQEVKNILANLDKGQAALSGIVPPAPAPEARQEVPVQEKQQETR